MAKQVLVDLNLNGNEIQNVSMQVLSTAPTSGMVEGQFYYNSTDGHAYQYVCTNPTASTKTYAWKVIGGVVDAALSSTSENAVQNKAVKAELDKKANSSSLAAVATSGEYSDLSGTPTIPTVPPSLKNPYALKIGGTLTYDGSAAKSITAGTNVQISSTGTISATDTKYSAATTSAAGLMSAADKTKLDGIATGANKITVDSAMSSTSTNPVQNKVVNAAISDAIAASDAMIFKGTLGTDGTITALPTTYKTGWTYRVITAGTYAGNKCEIGDLIIALVDRAGSGNVNADWTVAQTNIDGAITSISGTSPISVSGTGASRAISHSTSDVEAGSYGLSSTATPAFGGKFNVPYVTVDTKGHLTDASTYTVTIPSTTATTSTKGLMSTTQVSDLNKALSSDTTTVTADTTTVDIGLKSIGGTSKTMTLPAATSSAAGVMTATQAYTLDTVYNGRLKRSIGRINAGSTRTVLSMTSSSSLLVTVLAFIGIDEVIVDVCDDGDGDVIVTIAKAITSDIAVVMYYVDSLISL
jgi:hypothetical protein